MSEETERKAGTNKSLIVIMLLLVLTNLATVYMWLSTRSERNELVENNTDLSQEKSELEVELNAMLAKYDTLQTDNAEMQAQIEEQKEQIKKLLAEAEKHKDDAWTIYKLRKEAATLREVMKHYLYTIDSLNTANQELIAQKVEVEKQLSNRNQKVEQLEQKTEDLSAKVKLGSKLRVVDLAASGQRVKNATTSRETDRAKRTDKIKTCFTIDKNEVAKPGKKVVYLRIIDPSGEVLAFGQEQEYMFTYDGKEGLYSRKEEIIYENEEADMCLYWDVQKELLEGKYIVEVYAEDYLMGQTSFELR